MFAKALSIAVIALIVALINTALLVSAIPKISAVGAKFFTEDGDQFYIKGKSHEFIVDIGANFCFQEWLTSSFLSIRS